MKKTFTIALAALVFTACNNTTTTETATDTTITDTMAAMPLTTDTTVAVTYTPGEGDVIYKDNKVYVMKNGVWVEAEKDITLGNDVVVYKTGSAERAGKKIKLKEGEAVDATGRFFDKAGKAIANAWDDTKDAIDDAAKAVDKTAKKVGNKIDTIINGKNK